jgi:hypothetical protein
MEGLDMNRFTHRQSRCASALAGKIVISEDARFYEARRAWNLAVDQEPAAVVFPESAPDVAAAVRHMVLNLAGTRGPMDAFWAARRRSSACARSRRRSTRRT